MHISYFSSPSLPTIRNHSRPQFCFFNSCQYFPLAKICHSIGTSLASQGQKKRCFTTHNNTHSFIDNTIHRSSTYDTSLNEELGFEVEWPTRIDRKTTDSWTIRSNVVILSLLFLLLLKRIILYYARRSTAGPAELQGSTATASLCGHWTPMRPYRTRYRGNWPRDVIILTTRLHRTAVAYPRVVTA